MKSAQNYPLMGFNRSEWEKDRTSEQWTAQKISATQNKESPAKANLDLVRPPQANGWDLHSTPQNLAPTPLPSL